MNTRRTHCHSYRHGRAGAFPDRGGNFPEAWDWAFPGRASGPFQTGGRLAALPPAIPAIPPGRCGASSRLEIGDA